MRFAIFPVRVFKASPATKKGGQVIQSAAPVTQNHLSKLEDLMLQNATPLRKSAPWPPNISDEHVSCTAPTTETASYIFTDPLQMSHACQRFWPGAESLAPATRNDVQTSKNAPKPSIFHFWLPSRHNGVHFFDISTSKSGPRPSVLNLTSKCASRHNGMHFSLSQLLKVLQVFIWPDVSAPAALAGLLFDPPEPRIIRKTQWIATFLPSRAPASSFFWLFLFSDLLSSSLLFSDSSHLCFSICPYCWLLNFLRQ